ncbi:hypothetical protein ACROYT_G014308 [Oculina patagonica]
MPVTRVGAPPLIAAPAHEWNTLLTVLKQAQAINVKVVGQQRKTIISLDMGLYMPAKKLQMARDDLSNIILCQGELRIVMAQLKTIGAYIENSGIDMAWKESDIYGPSTVKQILEGNHVKQAETAHLVTLQSLFIVYQEILHVFDTASHGATEINIVSPDTDVFILSLRRYPQLCNDECFVTGTGQRHRVIKLKPIVQALGSTKVAALPGLHALSGADVTGSFSGKGKATWWKIFKEADEETITTLANLRAEMVAFPEEAGQSENLPPTQEALWQAIKRGNYQALVWNLDVVPEPQLPSPETFGWKLEDDKWVPVMTSLPPAPEAIIQLVKCGCVKSRCSLNRCNCRKAELKCTDLCSCADSGDPCDNQLVDDDADFEDKME